MKYWIFKIVHILNLAGDTYKCKPKDWVMQLMLYFIAFGIGFGGPLDIARFFLEPCAPPFFGSMVLNCQECGDIDRSEIAWWVWIAIPLIDIYPIVTILHSGLFYICYVQFVSIYTLLALIDDLHNRYTRNIYLGGKSSPAEVTLCTVLILGSDY